ncbi:MAG: GTP-binding protein [Maribacter sp.]|nr:GTP-binding protein [Maribacter sp.]
MDSVPNNIALRPRFQIELKYSNHFILDQFEKTDKPPFVVKRIDEHVFIKFNAEKVNFWSPQLHLEIIEIDSSSSTLFGVFGPNPTLWTFFMFLHFGVATIFIILGVWAYSSASLGRPYSFQMMLMLLMALLWLILYAFGRAGRYKGKPQMLQLYDFMHSVLDP